MIPGNRYCCAITNNPSKHARIMLWIKVRRITRPSLPTRLLVETPVVTFCGEIILLMTVPDELVAAKGLSSWCQCETLDRPCFPWYFNGGSTRSFSRYVLWQSYVRGSIVVHVNKRYITDF